MDIKREIKQLDINFIRDCFQNKKFTRLNSGQVSHTFRLKSDGNDIVLKYGNKFNSDFKIENFYFPNYLKKVSTSKRNDFEQEKITQLYKDGFNVVEPVESDYSGFVLTQYNPAINFGLNLNASKKDYLQIVRNLNNLHKNSIYHGDPHLNNIFYDENLTWFDFDTILKDSLDFDVICGRDLRITLLSMLNITDDSNLVKACFNAYEGDYAKNYLIAELEAFNPYDVTSYTDVGFGNPIKLKEILKGDK